MALRSKEAVAAWTANLSCKFSCANACPVTGEFFQKLFGSEWKTHFSGGGNAGEFDPVADWFGLGEQKGGGGFNTTWLPRFEASRFGSDLRTGGPENDLKVDCVFSLAGRLMPNGKPYQIVTFTQG